MLKLSRPNYYKVQKGQTIRCVADAFCVSEWKLAKENGLTEEICEGQILKIPAEYGNRYTVQVGDTKRLLCCSEENFRRWNGTDVFFIGMRIVLCTNKKEE